MTEYEIVKCDHCNDTIHGEYQRVEVNLSKKTVEDDHDDEEGIVSEPRLEAIGYAPANDLSFSPWDTRVEADICSECFTEVEDALDAFVELVEEAA